jgi:hypothetical protein
VAAGDAEVLLQITQVLLGLAGGAGQARAELQGREVLGRGLEDRVDLGERGRGIVEREQKEGDLEAQAQALVGVGRLLEAAGAAARPGRGCRLRSRRIRSSRAMLGWWSSTVSSA